MPKQDAEIVALNSVRTNRELGQQLLKASDWAICAYSHLYLGMCRRMRFEAGHTLVELRLRAAIGRRDAHGQMDRALAVELEEWRLAISQYVANGGGNGPTDESR